MINKFNLSATPKVNEIYENDVENEMMDPI